MKLRNLFYVLLCMPLAFAACTPGTEEEPKGEALVVTTDALNFKADGGVGMIEYNLNRVIEGAGLNATCEAEWVSNITVGDNITFIVAANTSTEARQTVVNVTYDTLAFQVAVSQEGKAASTTPVFELVGESTLTFGQDGGVGSFAYKLENPIASVNIELSTVANWISQLTVASDDSEIRFLVAANSGEARSAKIKATYGMLEFEVTVEQDAYVAPAPVITLEATALSIAAEGGAQSVTYSIENTVEGVELAAACEAEWISNLAVSAEAITFDVAAFDGASVRSANIVLTYAEVTADIAVMQVPAGANPDMDYIRYDMVWLKATTRAANQWNLIMSEMDEYNVGEIFTRISIQLPADNAMYITDGTYTVANEGILLNSTSDNSFSTYCYNGSGSDITDATVEVVNDFENKTSIIKGTFTVGNTVRTFEFRGTVDGFVYEKLGDDGITEWDSFRLYSQWDDTKYLVAKASGITFDIYLKKLGGKKSDPLAAGTYPVRDWEYTTTCDYCDKSSTKINGTLLVSGEFVVEEDAAGYKITFEVVDTNGTTWKGTYVGPIA